MFSVPPARAWRPAVGAPLERGVRQHYAVLPQEVGMPRPCYFAWPTSETSCFALPKVGNHALGATAPGLAEFEGMVGGGPAN